MVLELAALRERERDAGIASAYRAAIERLLGLVHRLQTRPQVRVYGLPTKVATHSAPDLSAKAREQALAKATAASLPPESPRRTLPLGPVPAVVRTRKPRRH